MPRRWSRPAALFLVGVADEDLCAIVDAASAADFAALFADVVIRFAPIDQASHGFFHLLVPPELVIGRMDLDFGPFAESREGDEGGLVDGDGLVEGNGLVKGGKIRCRSRGDYGAEVFICNAYEKQRCSAQTIYKALNELRLVNGSPTGAVIYETAQGSGLLYGFEHFCKGTVGNCSHYDAVDAHCNREKTRWSRHRLQYDGLAKKRRVEDFSYKGTTWLEKPTPKPAAEVHGWSTFRTTEPTPDPNSGARNVAVFTQVTVGYATRSKPQATAQAPSSFAIVPEPTAVPKA